MPAERPEPTLKEILEKVRAIVHGEERNQPAPKPLFGFSPGLLLMAIVAVAISAAAAVKILK